MSVDLGPSERLFRVLTNFEIVGSGKVHLEGSVIVATPFDLSREAYYFAGRGKDGRAIRVRCRVADCVEPVSEDEAMRIISGVGDYGNDYWDEGLSEYYPMPELSSEESVRELLKGSEGEE